MTCGAAPWAAYGETTPIPTTVQTVNALCLQTKILALKNSTNLYVQDGHVPEVECLELDSL